MKLERTEINKVIFKNCKIEKDSSDVLWIVEDLGDNGTETRSLEEIIQEVFGEENFNITIQSKVEL